MADIKHKRSNQISTLWIQLCVPRQFRLYLMTKYHEISHAGPLKTYLTLRQKFWWHGAMTDITYFCKSCQPCQRCKGQTVTPVPLASMPVRELFSCIHIDHHDMSGIKTTEHDYKYVFIMCDSLCLQTVLWPTKTTGLKNLPMSFLSSGYFHLVFQDT